MSVLTAIQLLRWVAVDAFVLFFCPLLIAQPALYLQSSSCLPGTLNAPPTAFSFHYCLKLSPFVVYTSHSPSCSIVKILEEFSFYGATRRFACLVYVARKTCCSCVSVTSVISESQKSHSMKLLWMRLCDLYFCTIPVCVCLVE